MKALESSNSSTPVVQDGANQIERYKHLFTCEKIRQMSPNAVEAIARESVLSAYFFSGNKLPGDDSTEEGRALRVKEIQPLVQELYNNMKNDYPGVAGEEVREAIKRGASGRYGKVYGINPAAWHEWIAAYLKNETRLLALKSLEQKPEPAEPSEEEKREKMIAWYGTIDELYRARKSILDHPSVGFIFRTLLDAKLIDYDFTGMMEDAIERVRDINNGDYKPGNWISSVNRSEKMQEGSEEWNAEVLRTCKAFRVSHAFNKMNAVKFDLKNDLINKL